MKKICLLIFAIIGCSFVFCDKTFAVDDIVYNINSSSTFPFVICSNPDNPCSQFSFVKVEPVPSVNPSNTSNSYFTIGGLYGSRVPTFVDSYYEINSFISGLTIQSWSSNLTSVKITLTNSIQANCPEPPPPEPCVPDENSHYVQAVIDSFWNYHTAFASSVVALIAIFLVYRLLKGRLR